MAQGGLLIANVEMPHMNGIELISALRSDTSLPFVPVLFLTAVARILQR